MAGAHPMGRIGAPEDVSPDGIGGPWLLPACSRAFADPKNSPARATDRGLAPVPRQPRGRARERGADPNRRGRAARGEGLLAPVRSSQSDEMQHRSSLRSNQRTPVPSPRAPPRRSAHSARPLEGKTCRNGLQCRGNGTGMGKQAVGWAAGGILEASEVWFSFFRQDRKLFLTRDGMAHAQAVLWRLASPFGAPFGLGGVSRLQQRAEWEQAKPSASLPSAPGIVVRQVAGEGA